MKTARVAYSGAIHSATPLQGDDTAQLRLADGRTVAEADVVWLPPFEVGSIIALGLNYADHVKELAKELTVTTQDEPLVFLKGPGQPDRPPGPDSPPGGRGLHAL
jgi:5-oxopent-3-ene-1,2,5-tricarboxylate decarboxylase/2-hydroxyhepta-2,4-diene-1,7-dioate isomerase